MKSDVDTRVVRMEFDNKQFEKNVKKSTKSINELKQTLDFKGVGESIDKVKVKFNALQIAATTAIAAITTKVVNLGIAMVKSLSVDNIASGWAKYGEKTIAVATMMAQKIRIAGEEISDLAKKTEVVNEQLDRLTWFADETSYSFTDMTNYVGKFIAAGQDLDKSVKAMEGIATWAALAGQNSQTASRAMMQLAQAMGRSINRQDWSSIQTANMDMEEFREKALETAVALGTLTKEGDKFVTKTGKKFDKSGFVNFLSEGWFTADVLVETLNKYSAAVDEIYKISIQTGKTATEVLEEYGDQFDEFAIKAFKAAQEARTFKDVVNAVKDAVTSKWMTTFENIFGNKDESVKLWSKLANELYDVFAESGNFRNNVLAAWKEMEGREDIFGEDGAFWNLYYALKDIRDLIKEAWNTIFPITEMEDENDQAKDIARTLKAITKQINDFTKKLVLSEKASQRISKIFKGLFSIIQVGVFALKAIRYVLDPILYTLKALANQTLNKVLSITGGIEKILNYIYKTANNLNTVLWDLIEIINPSGLLTKLFNFITSLWSIIADYNPILRLTKFIENLFTAFKEGGGTTENLTKIFKGVLSLVSIVGKVVIQITKAIVKYVLPVLDRVIDAISYIVGFLGGVAVNIIAVVSDIITSIDEALSGGNLDGVGDSIKNFLNFIPKAVKAIIPVLQALWSVLKALIDVSLLIPRMLDAISKKLTGKGIIDNLVDFFNGFSVVIKDFIAGIEGNEPSKTGSLQGLMQAFIFFFQSIGELLKGLIATAQWLLVVLGTALRTVGIALQKLADIILKIFAGKWKELTSAQRNMIRTLLVLGTILITFWALWSIFWRLINVLNPLGAIADSLVNVLDKGTIYIFTLALNSIGSALLKFAAALWILNKIDQKVLYGLLIAGGIIAAIIAIAYYIKDIVISLKLLNPNLRESFGEIKDGINNLKDNNNVFKDLGKIISSVGNLLLKIALAVMILSKLNIDKNSFGKVAALLLMISGLVIALVGVSKLSNNAMTAGVQSLSQFQKNTAIFGSETQQTMGSLQDIIKVLSVVGNMMLKLALVALIFDKLQNNESWGMMIATFVLLTGFVIALVAVSKLTNTKTKQAAKYVSEFTNSSRQFMGSLNGAIKALLALAGVVAIFASIAILFEHFNVGWKSWGMVMIMLTAIAAILVVVGIIIKNMNTRSTNITSNANKSKTTFIQLAAVLAALGQAILSIAIALAIVSRLDPTQMMYAAITLGSIMVALLGSVALITVVASKSVSGGSVDKVLTKVSLALITLAGAFITLALSLRILEKIDFSNTAKGLALMVGSAAALTVIGYAAKNVIGIIIALATAVAILGAASLMIASAVALISATIGSLIGNEDAILGLFEILAKGITMITKAVIVGITEAISESLIVITKTVGKLLALTINILTEYGAPLINVVSNLIRLLLDNGISILKEYGPKLGITAFEVLLQVLEYVAANADRLFTVLNTLAFAGIESLVQFLINNIQNILTMIVNFMHNLIQGLISNLSMIIGDIVDLVTAIINAIVEVLPSLITTILGAVKTLIIGLWNGIMDVFGAEGAKITEEKFDEIFGKIIEAIGRIFEVITDLLAKIGPIVGTILNLVVNILEKLWPIIEAILYLIETILQKIDWDSVLNFIGDIAKVIAQIIELLAPIFDLLNPILKLIMSIVNLILDLVLPVLIPLLELLDPIVKILSFIIQLISELVGPLIKTLLQFISLIGDTLNAFLQGDFEHIGELWSNFFGNMKEMWSNFGRNVANYAKEMWAGLVDWFKNGGENVIKGLIEGLSNIGVSLKSWFGNMWDNIKKWFCDAFGIHSPSTVFADYGSNLMEGLLNGLKGAWDSIMKFFSDLWGSIKSGFSTLWDNIKSGASNIWNNVTTGVTNAWNTVTSTISNVGSTVAHGIQTGWQVLTETVQNVTSGIASSPIGQAVSNAASAVTGFFSNLFGVHSPSTVFADIGKNLILGLGVGIEKQANDYSTKDSIKKACSKVLSDVQEVLDADENDITISVGLDISNVEEKAGRVQDIMNSVGRDIDVSAYGANIGKVSSETAHGKNIKDATPVTTNNNVSNTNNNVFNIKSTNPKEAADEIDKILQEKAKQAKLARGGI